MAGDSKHSISAIIATLGRPDTLEMCLRTVAAQSILVNEVLVVHCGDDPETPAICVRPEWQEAGVFCRYFRFPRRNAAAQRDFAVHLAQYDTIMLLDDDVELEPDFAEQLLRPLWSDPRVGATMGKIVNFPMARPTPLWVLYRRLLDLGGTKLMEPGRLVGAALPNGFPIDATEPMSCEWLTGCDCAFRRQAYDDVKGFAPYFDGSSPGEDLDLGYRISRRWKMLYIPDARCVHHLNPGRREAHELYNYHAMRSRYAITRYAYKRSLLKTILHLVFWGGFQYLSEIVALRKGWNPALFDTWRGRWRGLKSCIQWKLPSTR